MNKKLFLQTFNVTAGIAVGISTIGVAGFVVHDVLKTEYIVNDILYHPKKIDKSSNTFSYLDSDNNKVGFDNVEFKSYINKGGDSLNDKIPFIDEEGKKYLIDRFIETGIFGPEISSLKSITIGDREKISNDAVGVYYPLTNEIFINTLSNSQEINNSFKILMEIKQYKEKYVTDEEKNSFFQKMKAEVVFETLMHEYLHHVVSTYVQQNLPTQQIPIYTTKGKDPSLWNKHYVQKFKKLLNYDRPTGIKKAFSLNEGPKSISSIFDVKDLYKISNEGEKTQLSDDELSRYAFVPKDFVTSKAEYLNRGIYLPVKDKEQLIYLYSLEELSVRKLLLAAMAETNVYDAFMEVYAYYLSGEIIADIYIPTIYERALARTDFVKNNITNSLYSTSNNNYKFDTKRYLYDNVFASSNLKSTNEKPNKNVSKELVELLDTMMGNKDGADISFMSSKNNMKISDKTHVDLKEGITNESMNNINIGGYIHNDQYKTDSFIGYIENKKFKKLASINVYKHKNKYKSTLFQIKGKELGMDKYFYYSDRFNIKKKYKKGMPLAIAKMSHDGTIDAKTIYKLESFRGEMSKQETGYASNYTTSFNKTIKSRKSISKGSIIWYFPKKNSNGIVIEGSEYV